jgi:hypothetical protein
MTTTAQLIRDLSADGRYSNGQVRIALRVLETDGKITGTEPDRGGEKRWKAA